MLFSSGKVTPRPLFALLPVVFLATSVIPAPAQQNSVAESLRQPVLNDAGLSTYKAVLSEVCAADEAADSAFTALTSKEALAAHQKRLREQWLNGWTPSAASLNAHP